jgi:hypothetical protein
VVQALYKAKRALKHYNSAIHLFLEEKNGIAMNDPHDTYELCSMVECDYDEVLPLFGGSRLNLKMHLCSRYLVCPM